MKAMRHPSKGTTLRNDTCSEKLKVLADRTRLSVLRLLMREPMHVGELMAALTIDQSLLSHHLKVLRESGLVRATRDGKAVLYCLLRSSREKRFSNYIDLGCCSLSFE